MEDSDANITQTSKFLLAWWKWMPKIHATRVASWAARGKLKCMHQTLPFGHGSALAPTTNFSIPLGSFVFMALSPNNVSIGQCWSPGFFYHPPVKLHEVPHFFVSASWYWKFNTTWLSWQQLQDLLPSCVSTYLSIFLKVNARFEMSWATGKTCIWFHS